MHKIRPEHQADVLSIRAVNQAAFSTTTEADLVDALRERAKPIVSLVADEDGAIVGHIMARRS
jgi:putative acetyltransferase